MQFSIEFVEIPVYFGFLSVDEFQVTFLNIIFLFSNFTLSSSKFPTVFQLALQSNFDVKMIIDKFLWQQHFKESIGWQLQSIFLFFKFNSKSKLSKESFEFLKNTFCIEVWSRRSKSSICAKWSVSVSSQWWQSKVV